MGETGPCASSVCRADHGRTAHEPSQDAARGNRTESAAEERNETCISESLVAQCSLPFCSPSRPFRHPRPARGHGPTAPVAICGRRAHCPHCPWVWPYSRRSRSAWTAGHGSAGRLTPLGRAGGTAAGAGIKDTESGRHRLSSWNEIYDCCHIRMTARYLTSHWATEGGRVVSAGAATTAGVRCTAQQSSTGLSSHFLAPIGQGALPAARATTTACRTVGAIAEARLAGMSTRSAAAAARPAPLCAGRGRGRHTAGRARR